MCDVRCATACPVIARRNDEAIQRESERPGLLRYARNDGKSPCLVSQSLVSQSLVSQSLVSQSLVSQSLVSQSLVSQSL